jgi:hypothetical protein
MSDSSLKFSFIKVSLLGTIIGAMLGTVACSSKYRPIDDPTTNAIIEYSQDLQQDIKSLSSGGSADGGTLTTGVATPSPTNTPKPSAAKNAIFKIALYQAAKDACGKAQDLGTNAGDEEILTFLICRVTTHRDLLSGLDTSKLPAEAAVKVSNEVAKLNQLLSKIESDPNIQLKVITRARELINNLIANNKTRTVSAEVCNKLEKVLSQSEKIPSVFVPFVQKFFDENCSLDETSESLINNID